MNLNPQLDLGTFDLHPSEIRQYITIPLKCLHRQPPQLEAPRPQPVPVGAAEVVQMRRAHLSCSSLLSDLASSSLIYGKPLDL